MIGRLIGAGFGAALSKQTRRIGGPAVAGGCRARGQSPALAQPSGDCRWRLPGEEAGGQGKIPNRA